MSQEPRPLSVFLSYTHDSPEHDEQVLALADRLRSDGIDALLDQYELAPPSGWTRWMRNAIQRADFVLVICTRFYKRRAEGKDEPGKGHGGNREGLTIDQEIYESGGRNDKFIAVTLRRMDRACVPDFLRPYQGESIETEEGYEKLYRRLTKQPYVVKPELGTRRSLPARDRKTTSQRPATESSMPPSSDGQARASKPKRSIVKVRTRGDVLISLRRVDANNYEIKLNVNDPEQVEIRHAIGRFQISLETLLAATHDPDLYGKELTSQLFADPIIRQLYAFAKIASNTDGWPLRIRLSIDDDTPELHSIHWELLQDPDTGLELATSERNLFSRAVETHERWHAETIRRLQDLKALIAVPAPSNAVEYGLTPIDTSREHELGRQALGNTRVTEAAQPVTIDRLITEIRHGVDVVYLVAHGSVRRGGDHGYYLFLQDEEGKAAPTRGIELVRRINDLEQKPRLIVLASSSSATIALNLINAGIPAVLAMQDNITLETLHRMVPTFFGELLKNGQVDRATAVARGSVRDRHDHWVPTLSLSSKTGRLW